VSVAKGPVRLAFANILEGGEGLRRVSRLAQARLRFGEAGENDAPVLLLLAVGELLHLLLLRGGEGLDRFGVLPLVR